MIRLAIGDSGLGDFLDVTETETEREGPSYTIDSLKLLQQEWGEDAKISFILGADMCLMLDKWHEADELLRRFSFICLQRPGFSSGAIDAVVRWYQETYGTETLICANTLFDVSSTKIRERVASGHRATVLTPPSVERYIDVHGLYRNGLGRISPIGVEALIRASKSPDRYSHTMKVLDMAVELARIYDVDVVKARVAALFHDLCKDGTAPGNDLEHAGAAADRMAREFGVTDADVLNAVRYHTTGRAGMSRLEIIIFLADTLEPTRAYEGVDKLRALVYEDLYAGALKVFEELGNYLKRNGLEMTRDSENAIEWLGGVVNGTTEP
jgi:nicotinate-nucleotide adenylyltransferase